MDLKVQLSRVSSNCQPAVSRRGIAILAYTLICSGLAGCQPAEEITTYTEQRTSPPTEPLDPEKVREQLDYTWAGMLPVQKQVWFFKLSGKSPAVKRHLDEAAEFLSSLQPSDSSEKPFDWKLPVGWAEKGPSQMRLATLVIPDEQGELELAVSSLPRTEDWPAFVTMNVNRWLGQLSQAPLAQQTILNLTKKVKTPAGEATVVELMGVLNPTSGMPGMASNPHAGMGMMPGAVPGSGPSGSAEFDYETPEGWAPGPTSAMRKAAFKVSEDGKIAEVTVISFPTSAGPQITDVGANLARWAGQVGIDPSGDLSKYVESIEVDGNPASFATFLPDGEPNGQAGMLGVMFTRQDSVWFVKLVGDKALVEDQKQEFQEFLASLKFK